ncbi:hypothetical protein F5Y11DRAFT_251425 [Daldinia sp. FL1419]|nr:hypothetical protein F5Y11DRAFT_251425 [Daldinia sp. FL1419]
MRNALQVGTSFNSFYLISFLPPLSILYFQYLPAFTGYGYRNSHQCDGKIQVSFDGPPKNSYLAKREVKKSGPAKPALSSSHTKECVMGHCCCTTALLYKYISMYYCFYWSSKTLIFPFLFPRQLASVHAPLLKIVSRSCRRPATLRATSPLLQGRQDRPAQQVVETDRPGRVVGRRYLTPRPRGKVITLFAWCAFSLSFPPYLHPAYSLFCSLPSRTPQFSSRPSSSIFSNKSNTNYILLVSPSVESFEILLNLNLIPNSSFTPDPFQFHSSSRRILPQAKETEKARN